MTIDEKLCAFKIDADEDQELVSSTNEDYDCRTCTGYEPECKYYMSQKHYEDTNGGLLL